MQDEEEEEENEEEPMFVTEQVQKGKKSRADKSASRSSKKSISEDSYLQHNQLGGKPAIQPTRQQEIHPTYQPAIFSVKNQQSPKAPTYKMTFNLTEDVYKSFNDLYAHRMLQGRKTEKSEMICEAIEWLIKMEGR